MGGGSFSHSVYARVSAVRTTKSVDAVFTHNETRTVDNSLDPMGLTVRESRDSAEHPESNAVAIWFDQTGSMGKAPEIFAKSALGNLMKLLLAKGYLDHPQILFGCYGDFSDHEGVVQIGQFESDQRIDDCLTKMYLVGGGGGSHEESAELPMYIMARNTSIDCFEKRGKKGSMFIVTDELPYSKVSAYQVEKIFGAKLQSDIPVESMMAELQEKYEVFVVYLHTGHYSEAVKIKVLSGWKKLLGERVLELSDPAHICETIGTTIGLLEGRDVDGITRDLIDTGSSPEAVRAAVRSTALVVPGSGAASGAMAKAVVTGGELPAVRGTGGGIERL